MRAVFNKIFLSLACFLMAFSLISCGANKNDREYQISEIVGTYEAFDYRNETSYDYYLVINETTGKAYYKVNSFYNDRYGNTDNVKQQFEGVVNLTKDGIKVGNYSGYITTKNGTIYITINDRTYEKTK